MSCWFVETKYKVGKHFSMVKYVAIKHDEIDYIDDLDI